MAGKCHLKYEDLGWKYMENARARTTKDPWDSFIYGVALTMTMASRDHALVIRDIKEQTPTVESAQEKCHLGRPAYQHANLARGRVIQEAMCENSRAGPKTKKMPKAGTRTEQPSWDYTKHVLRECTGKSPDFASIRERLKNNYLFRQQKGRDMLMLESGCEQPVMDIWMLRRSQKVPEELWDDDPTTEYLRSLQDGTKKSNILYEENKKIIQDEADICGVPAGVYHVARWFEMAPTTKNNREEAERYLDELIKAIEPE